KHVSKLDMFEIRCLLQMFYALTYQKLTKSIPLHVIEEK
nr:sucrose synthase [Tanacetum cinerariifolium]